MKISFFLLLYLLFQCKLILVIQGGEEWKT